MSSIFSSLAKIGMPLPQGASVTVESYAGKLVTVEEGHSDAALSGAVAEGLSAGVKPPAQHWKVD